MFIVVRKLKSALVYLGIRGIIKTLYFNFKTMPFKEAIKFPVFLSRDVEIRNCSGTLKIVDGKTGCVQIGFGGLELSPHRKSMISIEGSLIVHGSEEHCFATRTILIVGKNATMEVGNRFSCAHDCKFYIRKSLKIGDDNMWSYYNIVLDTDGHPIYDWNGVLSNENKEIVFGNKVWMGCRCTVLKGGCLADNTIIASNSVISQKTPCREGCIITSDKVLRENISWDRTLL